METLRKLQADFAAIANQFSSDKPFRLAWPTEYNVITQPFGANPENYKPWGLPGHEGIDFKALHGSRIYACAIGVVYRIEKVDNGPYGIQVRLQHRDGFKTVYAHLLATSLQVGQTVLQGDIIGLADNTGNSRGSHLHLTLKLDGATASGLTKYPNDIIDPTPYLLPFSRS